MPSELALQAAAQAWCVDATSSKVMDTELATAFAEILDRWLEILKQSERNTEYYRGLVVQIGELFGQDAYTSDDGSVQQDVLCAKVPELVEALKADRDAAVRASLTSFWDALSVWSQATFGTDAERGPTGPLKHLAKEVHECLAQPNDLEEYADCLFLVFDACRRAGFTYQQLVDEIWNKLEVNKVRVWNKPTSDEPVEHVRKE